MPEIGESASGVTFRIARSYRTSIGRSIRENLLDPTTVFAYGTQRKLGKERGRDWEQNTEERP
jgi:hypothetical protein